MRRRYVIITSFFQSRSVSMPFTQTISFLMLIAEISVCNSSAARIFKRSSKTLHAISVALPLRSAVADAAEGDVLEMRDVLVVLSLIRSAETEKTFDATWTIFVL